MHKVVRRHTISFKHASEGLIWAVRTNPNYLVHLILSLFAIFMGYFLRVNHFEWLILALTIGLGLVVETLNSGLEAMGDAITREFREEIKIAKDVAAAAMLIYAVTALIIALLIFGPYLKDFL